MSALFALASGAPQLYRPAGYGYAAGQTSHQSVAKVIMDKLAKFIVMYTCIFALICSNQIFLLL